MAKFNLRIEDDLLARLKQAAEASQRSLNSEITYRLTASLSLALIEKDLVERFRAEVGELVGDKTPVLDQLQKRLEDQKRALDDFERELDRISRRQKPRRRTPRAANEDMPPRNMVRDAANEDQRPIRGKKKA